MNRQLKNSLRIAFDIIAGISTLVGIGGYTLKDINANLHWWHCLLLLILLYVVCVVIVYVIFIKIRHKPYVTYIKGKKITIKIGDIFSEQGIKVIPCNESFDTKVDDVVIAKNTLNGKMISNYVQDITSLNDIIQSSINDKTKLPKPEQKNSKWIFPLGRIIKYQDFALLAFTHFNEQNEAHIRIGEYEQCLFRMWEELRRIYAGENIVLPLIGAGITDIEGIQEKNNTFLLKCMLCTLRSSKFIPESGITIVLTDSVMETIDMNLIKEEF